MKNVTRSLFLMNFKDGKSLHDLLKSIDGDLSCQCKKSDMMRRAASDGCVVRRGSVQGATRDT